LFQTLQENKFIPAQTFEEFVNRQKKGKRRYFLRDASHDDPKKAYENYVKVIKQNKQ
jgi:hypothetical protein